MQALNWVTVKQRMLVCIRPGSLALLRSLAFPWSSGQRFSALKGFASALFHSALMTVVMYGIFERQLGTGITNYSLFVLTGVTVVGFFNQATSAMLGTFSSYRALLLNSTVPREIVLTAQVGPAALKFIGEISVCFVLAIFVFPMHASPLALLLLTVAYIAFVLGTGAVLCLFNSFVRDLSYTWGVAVRLLFFATPIFYELHRMSDAARTAVYWLNPLTPFVLAFRNALGFEGSLNMGLCFHSLCLGVISATLGSALFLKFEPKAVERS